MLEWTFSGQMANGNYSTDWVVELWGGDDRYTCCNEDPYYTDDRGLWFNGRIDFLQMHGLILHHTSTVTVWMKPHGDGTVFASSSKVDPDYAQSNIHLRVDNKKLEYGDTYRHALFQSDKCIELYYWQHAAFSIKWEQHDKTTTAKIFINNENAGLMVYDGITQDRPDTENIHTIGTLEFQGQFCDYFRGFLYSFYAYNYILTDFSETGA
jgi:hypothetical protein